MRCEVEISKRAFHDEQPNKGVVRYCGEPKVSIEFLDGNSSYPRYTAVVSLHEAPTAELCKDVYACMEDIKKLDHTETGFRQYSKLMKLVADFSDENGKTVVNGIGGRLQCAILH